MSCRNKIVAAGWYSRRLLPPGLHRRTAQAVCTLLPWQYFRLISLNLAHMDPTILQTLVQQAAQAEARLAQIESKLSASGSLPPSTVADLQELKALLLQAKADNEQLKAERDQALKAASAAEKEASKLNYRILHLQRAVQEAKARGAAAPSS